MPLTESQIENQICQYLSHLKDGYLIKTVPNGYFVDGKGFRKHKNPWARSKRLDLIFFYLGTSIHIEVKTEKEYKYIIKHYDDLKNKPPSNNKKKHYQEQIFAIESIKQTGNHAFFACNVELVKKEINHVRTNEIKSY